MKISRILLLAFVFIPLFLSCTNDEDVPVAPIPGAYENGFFVLNEGNATAGSITFVSNDLSKVQQDIYSAVNPSVNPIDGLGGYVQSIFFNGDLAYIISNGSNKITIVNRYTFKLVGKIESGLTIPRFGVVVNGKAYVTNLNTYAPYLAPANHPGNSDDFVAVINLTSNTVETTIPLGTFGEKIAAINGKIYIANGAFGEGNTMQILNPATNTVSSTLTFGASPNSMFEKNGSLYVLCSNSIANSELAKINTSTNLITSTITFDASLQNAQNLNYDNNKFYFSVGNKVYDEDLATTTVSATELLTAVIPANILYGMSVNKGRIFVTDLVDYASNAKINIFTASTGGFQKTIDVGLIPNGFYFN